MTLPANPPRYPEFRDLYLPIVRGEVGWRVAALTWGIRAKPSAENLGTFTVGLVRAVRRWQRNHDLYVDGVAGPATQLSILLLASKAADEKAGLPGGTSFGFVVYEGGSLLAATNWNSPGGVDCGPAQYRILGPPFDKARLEFAFNPWLSLADAAEGLAERSKNYYDRRPLLGRRRALEAAALHHNWPSGAQQIVEYGHVLRGDEIAGWTVKELNPDGTVKSRYTRSEWSFEYPRRILSYAL